MGDLSMCRRVSTLSSRADADPWSDKPQPFPTRQSPTAPCQDGVFRWLAGAYTGLRPDVQPAPRQKFLFCGDFRRDTGGWQ